MMNEDTATTVQDITGDKRDSTFGRFSRSYWRLSFILVSRRIQVWKRLVQDKQADIRASLTVNTDVVMGYTLAVRASLTYPTIITEPVINFSLTQVGSSVSKTITILNPSDQPIHVQLLPFFSSDDSPLNAASLLGNSPAPSISPLNSAQPSVSSFYLPPEALTGEIVMPHTHVHLGPLFFSPTDLLKVNGTLYVKNNLTVIDSVVLIGEGGSGRLTLQEGDTDLAELHFHLDHDQLKHCTSTDPIVREQEVMVSKAFLIVNKGNLPVHIESIGINGRKCEGYGFDVENCNSFDSLEAGESAKVSISFRPDFSSSVVKRDLLVYTSQGVFTFALVATLPYELLPLCVDSQPQGKIEETLRITIKGFMVVIFVILALVIVKEFSPSRNKYINHTRMERADTGGQKSLLDQSSFNGRSGGSSSAPPNGGTAVGTGNVKQPRAITIKETVKAVAPNSSNNSSVNTKEKEVAAEPATEPASTAESASNTASNTVASTNSTNANVDSSNSNKKGSKQQQASSAETPTPSHHRKRSGSDPASPKGGRTFKRGAVAAAAAASEDKKEREAPGRAEKETTAAPHPTPEPDSQRKSRQRSNSALSTNTSGQVKNESSTKAPSPTSAMQKKSAQTTPVPAMKQPAPVSQSVQLQPPISPHQKPAPTPTHPSAATSAPISTHPPLGKGKGNSGGSAKLVVSGLVPSHPVGGPGLLPTPSNSLPLNVIMSGMPGVLLRHPAPQQPTSSNSTSSATSASSKIRSTTPPAKVEPKAATPPPTAASTAPVAVPQVPVPLTKEERKRQEREKEERERKLKEERDRRIKEEREKREREEKERKEREERERKDKERREKEERERRQRLEREREEREKLKQQREREERERERRAKEERERLKRERDRSKTADAEAFKPITVTNVVLPQPGPEPAVVSPLPLSGLVSGIGGMDPQGDSIHHVPSASSAKGPSSTAVGVIGSRNRLATPPHHIMPLQVPAQHDSSGPDVVDDSESEPQGIWDHLCNTNRGVFPPMPVPSSSPHFPQFLAGTVNTGSDRSAAVHPRGGSGISGLYPEHSLFGSSPLPISSSPPHVSGSVGPMTTNGSPPRLTSPMPIMRTVSLPTPIGKPGSAIRPYSVSPIASPPIVSPTLASEGGSGLRGRTPPSVSSLFSGKHTESFFSASPLTEMTRPFVPNASLSPAHGLAHNNSNSRLVHSHPRIPVSSHQHTGSYDLFAPSPETAHPFFMSSFPAATVSPGPSIAQQDDSIISLGMQHPLIHHPQQHARKKSAGALATSYESFFDFPSLLESGNHILSNANALPTNTASTSTRGLHYAAHSPSSSAPDSPNLPLVRSGDAAPRRAVFEDSDFDDDSATPYRRGHGYSHNHSGDPFFMHTVPPGVPLHHLQPHHHHYTGQDDADESDLYTLSDEENKYHHGDYQHGDMDITNSHSHSHSHSHNRHSHNHHHINNQDDNDEERGGPSNSRVVEDDGLEFEGLYPEPPELLAISPHLLVGQQQLRRHLYHPQ
eukprot:TRINITY_DN1003_c0_g1_i1.p1 TRINITY_DN1003_c0_g1~~TRINITY_DN1003_c0_g1_i1.p1  ORF type:complete len:1504 (+),score=275.36 TRINITY_DN1003_c0_g1_i1:1230-5741(+)